MSKYNHGYLIFKKYSIEEIFNSLSNNTIPDKVLYHPKDYADSLRRASILKDLILKDGLKCLHCEHVPEFFAIGKDKGNRWHLDLYKICNDHLLMFTIDHIHPKSKGGKNSIENYQMLCKPCNEKKSDKVEGEEEVTQVKKIKTKSKYITGKITSLSQQIKGTMTKLKNHKLICVNTVDGFTANQEYNIVDFSMRINQNFDFELRAYVENDHNNVVETDFNNFITDRDL